MTDSTPDTKREFLRHTLATLAYRCGKALRDAPEGFGSFRANETTRTPAEILAHIGDLLDWALWLARGEHVWKDSTPLLWDEEVGRFFRGMRALEDYLASDAPLVNSAEKIFQGPVADALTHTGQISLLRRMAGAPVRGESYYRSDIVAGRVGPEQTPPRKEFD